LLFFGYVHQNHKYDVCDCDRCSGTAILDDDVGSPAAQNNDDNDNYYYNYYWRYYYKNNDSSAGQRCASIDDVIDA